MKTEHFMVSILDFFRVFFYEELFFPKFELLNLGCGLSVSVAYLRVFTVLPVLFAPLKSWVSVLAQGALSSSSSQF